MVKKYWPVILNYLRQKRREYIILCSQIIAQIKHYSQNCAHYIRIKWPIFIQFCWRIAKQIKQNSQTCSKTLWRVSVKLFQWIAVQIKRLLQGCLILIKILWYKFIKFCRWIANQVIRFIQSCLKTIWALWCIFAKLCGWIVNQIIRLVRDSLKTIREKWPPVKDRLYQYIQLTRLNKPIGIFLLLWPTLWALWIAAEGVPDLQILYIFILGVVLMRSAGCVINDLADRNLDIHVARTQNRPIAAGKIMPQEAMVVVAILIFSSLILVLNLNPLTLKLSVVAVVLAIIYPFMKRYTYLPQFFLGLAFGWAVPMAFAAQTNTLPLVAWLLLFTTVLWAVVYDTMYAMVDREDDIKAGIKSTAILFEDADRVIIGVIQLLVLFALVMVGNSSELGKYYYAGIAIAAVLSIYQQFLIKDRIPEHCFTAFLNSNWFGATVFTGVFLHYHFN
ncbi:MAG: 4-hydroxybenzoate octaprenyltransferase [Gammaproteobacteria bacterium]|nr:4-hydroxybenzoate octaprenyltransferase [Gammaproteobacteria bacterium]